MLCVSANDPRQAHLQDIGDLNIFEKLEIQHFFEVYKDLEPGKSVEGANWVGREEAEMEIRISYDREKKRLAAEAAIATGDRHTHREGDAVEAPSPGRQTHALTVSRSPGRSAPLAVEPAVLPAVQRPASAGWSGA